jgi:hypothetical protein
MVGLPGVTHRAAAERAPALGHPSAGIMPDGSDDPEKLDERRSMPSGATRGAVT